MKVTSKISIALVLALVFGITGISVWAAPNRQGTVPPQPLIIPVTGDDPISGGTFTVTLLNNCQATGTISRIVDPSKEVGPAPAGLSFLTDGGKVVLDKACDVRVCYPYPKEYEDKNGGIHQWDSVPNSWGLLESTISGDPKQICATVNNILVIIFGLIGK